MKTVLKILLSVVALVVVLIVLAAILVPMLVNPNDYKGRIAEEVQKQTGRTFSIEGDIGLSVFPWLGLEVGKVALGNAPGFSDPVFAGADRIDVRIKLLPLLHKEVEMDTVVLHGLRVSLARNKQGRTNWQDLTERESAKAGAGKPGAAGEATTEGAEAPPITALAIGGIDIRDGRIVWSDATAGQHYVVDDLSLQTGAIAAGRPVDLDLELHVQADKPRIGGKVSLKGELEPDLKARLYKVHALALKTNLKGEGLPVQTLDLSLDTDVTVDLAGQTLSMPNIRLDLMGAHLEGAVAAEQLLGEPRYNASLDVAPFSPRDLMERLGMPPVKTADPAVLGKASLSTRISGTAKSVSLEPLTASFDDTKLEGTLAVPSFAGPAVRFDLRADAIDADRYLPPPVEGQPAATAAPAPAVTPATAAAGATELPLATLRALDLDGRLQVGKLKISNLRISDIVLKLTGKNGVLKLDPAEAQLYQGSYRGQAQLDARGKLPRLSAQEKLTGIQVGPLLKDLTGKDQLTGTAQADASLQTVGLEPQAMKRALNGTIAFSVTDGAVKGINIGQKIREAKAKLRGEPALAEGGPDQEDFTELTGTVKLTNGIATNQDLMAKSPLLRVEGQGTVDLVHEQLDYVLTTVIVATAAGQGGKGLEDLKGLPIPIKITGSFQDPSYKVDLKRVVTNEVKQKVQQKAEKKLEEKFGDKAGGLLKGLFK